MKPEDFVSKDYELKVRYLTDHFSHIWNRFNYLVEIESAMLAGMVLLVSGKLSLGVVGAGMI